MPRLSPYSHEMNAFEKVRPYLCDRYLSGCLFIATRAIIGACSMVWNGLVAATRRIRPLTDLDRACQISP